jgi:hypothetical protein
MKKLFALLLLMLMPIAASDIHGVKLTGSGATVQVYASCTVALCGQNGVVKWIQFTTPSGNSATEYWGDGTVSSSTQQGQLPAGSGQMLPPLENGGYDLHQVYLYIASSDVVYVSWGLQ